MNSEILGPGPEDIKKKPVVEVEEFEEFPIQSESSIPKEITQRILNEVELPEEMPKIGSMMIEDFIIDKLRRETASEKIVEDFYAEDMPKKILDYTREIEEKSKEINWEEIADKESIENVKTKIIEEMKSFGMSEGQIEKIKDVDIEITSSGGPAISNLLETKILIDKLQITRKALEYQLVFGEKFPQRELITNLFFGILGHELGHQIDQIDAERTRKNLSQNIPYEWGEEGRNEDKSENPKERFAEYWGRAVIQDNHGYQEIQEDSNALLVWEFNKTWEAISNYNSLHPENKINLFEVFREISFLCQDKKEPELIAADLLLLARRFGYSKDAPENYASPYNREVIEKAIKES